MESMGVVVRRYIDYLILLIPTPLVSVLFCSSIPTFCSFFIDKSSGQVSIPNTILFSSNFHFNKKKLIKSIAYKT